VGSLFFLHPIKDDKRMGRRNITEEKWSFILVVGYECNLKKLFGEK